MYTSECVIEPSGTGFHGKFTGRQMTVLLLLMKHELNWFGFTIVGGYVVMFPRITMIAIWMDGFVPNSVA